jgi:hypothetical protein
MSLWRESENPHPLKPEGAAPGGKRKKKRIEVEECGWASWGAAVLRPYMIAN